MEIGNEVKSTVYDFDVDLTESERIGLFEYAREKMTEKEYEYLMIEWAMVHLIKQDVGDS